MSTWQRCNDIRDNSNEFGDVMQPDDDRDEQVDVPHRVDTLHRENIRVMKGTANTFFSLPPPRRQKNSEVVVFSLRYKNSQPNMKPVKPMKTNAKLLTSTISPRYLQPTTKAKKPKAKAKKDADTAHPGRETNEQERPAKQNIVESNPRLDTK
ncbi:hypothetical protein B0H14DRAFT_2571187 [Mycena olivaceomarginata]|nr:hypothetical protein B0H14DRAFT_2571187 [Mycena olivaceomarginata]